VASLGVACKHAFVSEPERDVDAADTVIATGVPLLKFLRLQLVLWAVQFLVWGGQAVTERKPLFLVMTVISAVSLGSYGWMAVSSPRVALILRDETLELRRWFRPLSLARVDIVAVRGDVAGQPSWSAQVLIQTHDRVARLPALDRKPAELILRLQEWAAVGETPRA
jgi:hypothetical protein